MARIKRIATELQVKDKLLDYSGDAGTSGQLLSSTGTGTNWITFSGVTASNGSSGRAAFFTGSTTIEGSDNFYWDNSNARLGIGTTSPGSALHVAGNIGSTVTGLGVHMGVFNSSYGTIELVGTSGAYIDFTTSGTDHKGRILYDHTSNYFRLDTNGSEKMRITSAGNVGIGTTSPDRKFEVESTGTGEMCITGTTGSRLYFRPTSAYTAGGNFGIIVAGTSSSPYLSTMDFTGYHNGVNTIMTMKGDGKVGISTTSPTAPLTFGKSVYGAFDSEDFYRIKFQDQGGIHNDVGIGQTASGSMGFNITAGNSFIFNNGTSGEIARFNGTGLGIGTNNPGVQLDVFGANGVRATQNSGALTDGYFAQMKSDYGENALRLISRAGDVFRATNYGQAVAILTGTTSSGTSEKMRITDTGRVGIGTTSPGTNLDIQGTAAQSLRVKSDGSATIIIDSDGDNDGTAGSYLHYRDTGATKWTLYKETNNDFYLHNAAASTYPIHARANGHIVLMEDGNNLGVGASSPAQKLHVVGTQIRLDNNSGGGGGYYLHNGSGTFRAALWDNGTNTRLFADGNGSTAALTIESNNATFAGYVSAATGFRMASGQAIDFIDSNIGYNSIERDTTNGGLQINTGGTASLNILDNGNATFAADVTVQGNLNVTGDINTISVTDLDVSDKTITVGVGQAENASGGSGLKVSGPTTEPSILWDETNDTWDFNYGIDVAGNANASGNITANKIGINKSSPSGRLHINQTADNQGIIIESGSVQPEIEFRDTATGDTFSIGHNRSASQLAIEVDGTDKYVFTDGGRLGIGTTSPGAALSAVTADTTVGIFKSTTDQTIIKIEDDDTVGYIGVKDNDIAIGGNSSMGADANFKIDVTTSTAAFGMAPSTTDKFRIRQTLNTSEDVSKNALYIDYNVSGSDALTADRIAVGHRIDLDSTATGGNQTEELSLYGQYITVDDEGDANHSFGINVQANGKKTANNDNQSTIDAVKGVASARHTSGQINSITGGTFIAQTDNNGGTINELAGVKGLIQNTGDAGIDVANARAGLFKVDISDSSNDPVYTTVYGVDSEIEMDETTTINNAFVHFGRVDANAGTITSAYLYRGTYNVHSNATVTHKHGIYLDGSDRNYIQGSMNLGGTGLYNQDVPLAVKAVAENTAEVLTKIWDGGNFAFSIDRSSTNTDANTELYRLGLNYNNNGAANGYIGFFRGSDGANGYLTFGSSNTERMRILSNGDIAINRTGQLGSAKLSITADAGEDVFGVQCNSNNTTTKLINVFNSSGTDVASITINNDSTPDMLFNVDDGSGNITEVLKLDSSQNATFTGDVYADGGDIYARATAANTNSMLRAVASGSGGIAGLGIDASNGDFAGSDYFTLRQLDNKQIEFNARTNTGNTIFYSKGVLNLTQDGATSTFAGNVITGGFFQTSSSTIVKKYVSSWNSGVQTHDVIYNGWYTNTGDYTYLKAAGNSTGGHGIILAADNGTYLGTTDVETGGVTDSATAPLTNTWAYFRNATAYIKGNTTFAGDVTINGSHLVLANGTTEAQATDYLYIGGDGLASADAAIYIGNGGSGDNVGWRLYYEGSGSGNDNKFIIKSENTGSPVDALAFTQDGNATFGADVTIDGGDLTVNNAITKTSGGIFRIKNSGGTTIASFADGGSTTFAGNVEIGTNTLNFADNGKARFGNSTDLQIYHDATNSKIENNTGELRIINNAVDKSVMLQATSDGSGSNVTESYLSLLPSFGSGAVFVYKDFLMAQDDTKIRLGASQDLEIYHDGTDSYIDDSGTGDLRIRSNFLKIEKYTGETMATFNDDNAVTLYYNNVAKFETTSDGIAISDYLIHSGDSDTKIGFFQNDGIIAYVGGNEVFSATSAGTAISHNGSAKIITQATSVDIYDADLGLSLNKVVKDRSIPCLFNSNFLDGTGAGINVVPFNSLSEAAVSTATYYHFLTMPYAGKLKRVVLKNVSGSLGSGFTTQLFLYVNGSQQASSSELSISTDRITWTPTSNNTFSAGDEISFAYQKSAAGTGITWAGVSFGVAIELTDYDI